MIQHIYRWDGEPLGFVYAGVLFDYRCHYLGWLEKDNSVWAPDGHYMGELVDSAYILRNTTRIPRLPKAARMAPVPPPPAMPPARRVPRPPQEGSWIDAL